VSVSEMRRQRKAKAAEALAAKVVAEATERVVARRKPIPRIISEADKERLDGALVNGVHPRRAARAAKAANPSHPSPPQDQAAECKRLRDGGMPWWQIGQQLGLVGHAASSAEPEGKRGASKARALYAAANRGEVPRSHAPRKGTTPRPQGVGRSGSKTDRKIQLVEHGHVIPRDMPDEEVEALLCGRTIEWAIDLARLTGTNPGSWGPDDSRWCAMEARVHPDPQWVFAGEDDKHGNRVVRFREYFGRDNHGNPVAGPTRTVRVDAIHTIR
jgi:hypothetical protein